MGTRHSLVEEGVVQQLRGRGSLLRVGLEAAEEEFLGLLRERLGDLRVHLVEPDLREGESDDDWGFRARRLPWSFCAQERGRERGR